MVNPNKTKNEKEKKIAEEKKKKAEEKQKRIDAILIKNKKASKRKPILGNEEIKELASLVKNIEKQNPEILKEKIEKIDISRGTTRSDTLKNLMQFVDGSKRIMKDIEKKTISPEEFYKKSEELQELLDYIDKNNLTNEQREFFKKVEMKLRVTSENIENLIMREKKETIEGYNEFLRKSQDIIKNAKKLTPEQFRKELEKLKKIGNNVMIEYLSKEHFTNLINAVTVLDEFENKINKGNLLGNNESKKFYESSEKIKKSMITERRIFLDNLKKYGQFMKRSINFIKWADNLSKKKNFDINKIIKEKQRFESELKQMDTSNFPKRIIDKVEKRLDLLERIEKTIAFRKKIMDEEVKK